MSPTLYVSEGTKAKLERLKGEDETFDELLARLADREAARTESAGAWAGTDKAEKGREAIEESRDGFRSG